MTTQRRAGQLWAVLAFAAIASTTLSLTSLDLARSELFPGCPGIDCLALNHSCADGQTSGPAATCNYLCVNATEGTVCARTFGLSCYEAVCLGGTCSGMNSIVPANCDDSDACTADTCEACTTGCQGRCVHTPYATGCNLPLGAPCEVGGQCVSTFCVDGVCCDTACTGPTEACNVTGSVGQCVPLAPNGTPCSAGDQCVSTFCVDGVCCDAACTGENEACNVTGSVGQCVSLAPLGTPCTAGDQCISTFCVDNVCCNTACRGELQSCTLPGSVGQCVSQTPAPLISGRVVVVIGLLLFAIGALSLRRALRAPHV